MTPPVLIDFAAWSLQTARTWREEARLATSDELRRFCRQKMRKYALWWKRDRNRERTAA
jgi:hypothetical protein